MAGPIDELKRRKLVKVLNKVSGNRTLAAEKLGVSVRTIRNWLRRFELVQDYPPQHGCRRPVIKNVKSRV